MSDPSGNHLDVNFRCTCSLVFNTEMEFLRHQLDTSCVAQGSQLSNNTKSFDADAADEISADKTNKGTGQIAQSADKGQSIRKPQIHLKRLTGFNSLASDVAQKEYRDSDTGELLANFKCKQCDYASKRLGYFKTHMWQSHGQALGQVFQCLVCSKHNVDYNNALRHVTLRHHKSRPAARELIADVTGAADDTGATDVHGVEPEIVLSTKKNKFDKASSYPTVGFYPKPNSVVNSRHRSGIKEESTSYCAEKQLTKASTSSMNEPLEQCSQSSMQTKVPKKQNKKPKKHTKIPKRTKAPPKTVAKRQALKANSSAELSSTTVLRSRRTVSERIAYNNSKRLSRSPLKCRSCPYVAQDRSLKAEHTTFHHIKGELKCKYCTYSCNIHDQWVRHMLLHDNPDRFYKSRCPTTRLNCTVCPYSATKPALKRHMAKHGAGAKYHCDHCNYSVDEIDVLLLHRKLHRSSNYITYESMTRMTAIVSLLNPSRTSVMKSDKK